MYTHKIVQFENNSPCKLLRIYNDLLHPLDVIILRQLVSKIMNA